jgi:outer membrane protein assembly factor BamB
MSRVLAALVAVVLLAGAGCASAPSGSAPEQPARPDPSPQTTVVAPQPQEAARIAVVDGDTGVEVRRALVSVGPYALRADGRGRALVPLARRGRLVVAVRAEGYLPASLRVDFRERSGYRVRIFRRDRQWPIYGANPARTQAQPGIKLRPPFRAVWGRNLGSLLEFPAVVWEGIAYINTNRGFTVALSMRNGRVHWRTRVGSLTASSPAVDPERRSLVVTTMEPGDVVVLDLRTGKVRWRYATGRAEPSPVIRGGIAYLASTNGNVYALNLERRKARWVHRGGVKITGSPALVGNRVYVGDYAGRVLALSARTGRRIWTGSAGGRVYGTTAVAGGRVFAPSVFSGLSALSARSGRLLWRFPVGAYLYSSPAVYRGRVYFGTYAGVVYCVSGSSGRLLWSHDAGGSVSGAVQVVGRFVYAASFGARISVWHWRTGKRVWTFPHGEYVPVAGNGGRLLLHGHTRVWAVEPVHKRR